MKASLTLFLAGVLAFWALASGIALVVWPDERALSLAYSAVAAGVCLVPSAVTLAWALGGTGRSPEQRRLVVLGGTGVRMFFVLSTGLLLTTSVGYFRRQSFWLWLVIFYLFTLALEMFLVVRALGARGARGPMAP